MGVLDRIRTALIGEAIAPPAALLDRYPELATARYRRGGLPPRVGGWALGQRTVAAITLWRTIFLAPGTVASAALLLHELRHVHQFQSRRSFPLHYLWESVRRGYTGNRYEHDARAWAAARLGRPADTSPSPDT